MNVFRRLLGRGTPTGPPDAQAVLRRARLLGARVVHGMAWPPPDRLPDLMAPWSPADRAAFTREFDQRATAVRDSLEASGLWVDASGEERAFFTARLEERSIQQYADASWAIESVGCCLWALRLLAEVPAYDAQMDGEVLKAVPGSDTPVELRPLAELERARGIAEPGTGEAGPASCWSAMIRCLRCRKGRRSTGSCE
jgi:hypothetical protein